MKTKPGPVLACITLSALSLTVAFGRCQSAHASGLLIADGGLGGVLEIKEQEVSVVINNGVAVTEIRQIFLNTEKRIVEALYTFPVPNGASVSNFSMIINGQEMVGEVVEKKRARQIYESYKSVKRDPGLLEQVDFKSFELRVFPIAPGAEQHIKIVYSQELDFDHDNATYVYPLATKTRPGITEKTTGKFAFTIDVKSAIPITKLSSPSHPEDFAITRHGENYTRASLEASGGDLSRDVVVAFDTQRPHTGIDLVASRQGASRQGASRQGASVQGASIQGEEEDGYFLMTMTAGKELEEYGAGMDYVFVVDISGSMQNDGKLTMSRNVVDSFVDALGKEDRFEVITFNTAPAMQFQTLTPVTDEARRASREFLLSQKARGGTVLRPAVTTAYKYKNDDRPLNVVILSDGMTEQKEQAELLALIEKAPSGTRVFCIGLGNEVNRPLLKQLAEGAGGLAAFVSQQDDFARQSLAFRRKLMRPVATNVKLAIDGVETYGVMPGALPDLFYGAPLRMYGRYKASGKASVTLTAEIMGQPVTQTMQVEMPAMDKSNPEIERMWAFHRVQQLMDGMRKGGSSQSQVDEIVRICEGYSIVSEYASFIVLENDNEYKRWAIERRNATRVSRDQLARKSLQEQLQRMRDQSLASLGPKETQLVSTENPNNPNGDRSDASTTSSNTGPILTPNPNVASPDATSSSNTNSVDSANGGDVYHGAGGSRGGGGAIDPITGLLAAGAAAGAAWSARRKKQK